MVVLKMKQELLPILVTPIWGQGSLPLTVPECAIQAASSKSLPFYVFVPGLDGGAGNET